MIITGKQTNVSVTPRKLRLVAYAVKKMTPSVAVEELTYLNKEAARVLVKVIKQALANAKNNFQIAAPQLHFKEIIINQARVLNRGRASARGKSKPYQHVFSHITVILESAEVKETVIPSKVEGSLPKKPAVKKAITKSKTKK